MKFIGKISFSMYMIHLQVFGAVTLAFGISGLACVTLSIFLSVSLGAVLTKFVETPMRNLLRTETKDTQQQQHLPSLAAVKPVPAPDHSL